ncbi:OmpA family protein [Actinotalea ferrariae]|uniref:OmpA family protein n=1 Tax=Actinotalea ferrariae TaxID=1386098 RepID=UPI001C8B819D|nr:OmpA family protein [Actinotalea ferrariae]MBX9245515.1 OmpA family protein [Actinotalea ferrariae]
MRLASRSSTPVALALCVVAGLTACTPEASEPTPTGSSTTSPSPDDGAPQVDAEAFEAELRSTLVLPPIPSFTVPTGLLSTAASQQISGDLDIPAGLYQGIAVVDLRCTDAGAAAADAGATPSTGAQHFDDETTSITVAGDGTGVYDAPGLHVAVLPDGSGVYEDGETRVSISADGSGTYERGDVRYTVRADGSGSYDDGATRVWVDEAGAGGYEDENLRVSMAADGEVFGDGDPALVDVVRDVLVEGLPTFPPVPRVHAVEATGTVCGTVIRLDANVLFDVDSAQVRPEGQQHLERVAELLVALGAPRAQVVGHTDSTGDEAYNQDLSERRAASVRDLLVTGGVASDSLETVGRGEKQPARAETGPDGAVDRAAQQLNRRVEIVLLS